MVMVFFLYRLKKKKKKMLYEERTSSVLLLYCTVHSRVREELDKEGAGRRSCVSLGSSVGLPTRRGFFFCYCSCSAAAVLLLLHTGNVGDWSTCNGDGDGTLSNYVRHITAGHATAIVIVSIHNIVLTSVIRSRVGWAVGV